MYFECFHDAIIQVIPISPHKKQAENIHTQCRLWSYWLRRTTRDSPWSSRSQQAIDIWESETMDCSLARHHIFIWDQYTTHTWAEHTSIPSENTHTQVHETHLTEQSLPVLPPVRRASPHTHHWWRYHRNCSCVRTARCTDARLPPPCHRGCPAGPRCMKGPQTAMLEIEILMHTSRWAAKNTKSYFCYN